MAEINRSEVCGSLKEHRVKNSRFKKTKFELKRSVNKRECNGSIEHIIELSKKYLSVDQVKFFADQLKKSALSKEDKNVAPSSSDVNFVDHFKSVAATLLGFRDDGFLCDTVLQLSDKVLKAHSVLLSAASPVFRAAFEVNGKAGMHYIRLPGVDSAVVEIALNYIYTGMLRLPWRYTRPTELPKLFAQLNHLGLSAEKLNGCEVMFLSVDDPKAGADSVTFQSTNVTTECQTTAVVNPDTTDTVQVKYTEPVINGRNLILSDAESKTTKFRRLKRRRLLDASNKTKLNKNADKLRHGDNSFRSTESVFVIDDDDEIEIIERKEIVNNLEPGQFIPPPSIINLSDTAASSNEVCSLLSSQLSRTNGKTNARRRSTNSISRRKRYKQPKTHLCAICGYGAATQAHLRQHNFTHSQERPFVCKFCKSSFRSSSNLYRHVKRHTGVRTHLCHLCGKGFIQKTGYDDHMLVHTQDYGKLFPCEHCGSSFNRVGNLRWHVKTRHTLGEQSCGDNSTAPCADKNKPFLCDLCGRSFASKATLHLHDMFHRGEKAFACQACAKRFVLRSQLNLHMRTHDGVKPYACEVCNKAFTNKSSRDRHARIHSGEKPYVCMTCGSQFRQSSHLKAHMLKHTGEKPYGCETCGKRYKEMVGLRLHYEQVHKTDIASAGISYSTLEGDNE